MRIFNAIIKEKYDLTTYNSLKKAKHVVLELKEKIAFNSGDSIAIYPTSDPEIANQVLKFLKNVPKEFNGIDTKEYLKKNIDLEHLNKSLASLVIEKQTISSKKVMMDYFLKSGKVDLFKKFIKSQSVLSFLEQNQNVHLTFEEFIKSALPIVPRLYSVASSPKKKDNQIDLTVGIIEYETSTGRKIGTCSKFFINTPTNTEIKCYLQPNPIFRLPSHEKDIIMIGTGTGIAPFRAFMQEREINRSHGKNWLFFGEKTLKNDFYYEDDLKDWERKGILKLDIAFSRDQEEKRYVQHIILEKKNQISDWIENGAHIYICGGREMGKDIDITFHRIIKEVKTFNDEQAKEYIKNLKSEKRYLKDVY